MDLAGRDLEVEPVERAGGAERLDQAGDLDRGGCHDRTGYVEQFALDG